MKIQQIRTLKTIAGTATLQFPKSFDEGSCKSESKKQYWEFTTTQIITEHVDSFDKKKFKKKYPELFEKYQIDLTPRLTVK